MTARLPSAQDGCLLLADITGYSAYLQGTELEHAQDVLADLIEAIIAGIEPPFEVSKLEGDAVFAHMPSSDVDAPLLFDTIESTYFAFRRRLRDVVHATTCDCDACVLIPSLDLKFFVHAGSYVVRVIGRNEELTGADVVLVHRLLKGSAREVVGNDAYLVVTAAVLDHLGVEAQSLGLVPHVESFDVGDVDVYIENLEERWVAEELRAQDRVTEETAIGSFSAVLPGTPQELWPWFTEPRKRLEWQDGLTDVTELGEGRRGVGTISHCAHGASVTVQQIVDWRPFSSYTSRDDLDGTGVILTATTDFVPADGGTKVTLRFVCEPEEAWPKVEENLMPALDRGWARLRSKLASR